MIELGSALAVKEGSIDAVYFEDDQASFYVGGDQGLIFFVKYKDCSEEEMRQKIGLPANTRKTKGTVLKIHRPKPRKVRKPRK